MAKIKLKSAKRALRATVPIMAGYLVLGAAFGILLADKGYSFVWAFVMSLTMYCGSMQFVAVGLLSSGASLVSSAIMTLLVNARHIIYGISMLKKYRGVGKIKPYLIFSLTDETYALLCGATPEQTDVKSYYFFVSLFNQCYWIIGSTVGALIGNALTFNTAGIDFAMTALFLIIFTEQWLSTKDHFSAVAGVFATLVCLVIFGTEKFLIPSMIIIVTALSVYAAIKERRKTDDR